MLHYDVTLWRLGPSISRLYAHYDQITLLLVFTQLTAVRDWTDRFCRSVMPSTHHRHGQDKSCLVCVDGVNWVIISTACVLCCIGQ